MFLRIILILIAATAISGCNLRTSFNNAMRPALSAMRPAPSPMRQAPPVRTSGPYTLDSGDVLRVNVFGQENLSRQYSVDGSGYISMPLIGAVRASGQTSFQLEKKIAAQLKKNYVKDPKVTVEVATYRPFFILGEVRQPGQFPYVNGMTVQNAVAIARGYTERARERKVQLTRRINGRDVKLTVPRDYPIRPGDTIYVMERFL